MIHRSLGSSLLCAAFSALLITFTNDAAACLTTTCAAENAPPSCVRGEQDGCWLVGAPLQWREPCVSFSVDARGIPSLGLSYADTEALVTTSFAAWTAVECAAGRPAIAVRSAGAVECASIEYNSEGPNSNAVIFQSKHWPHDPIAIGVTTVSFNPETGRIVDADIEINVTNGGLDALAVQYVLTHEAGHFFGIDHSLDVTAVMFAQSTSTSFSAPPLLSDDDQRAICLAYPTNRKVGACDFEPEKGYSPVCGGDLEASCALDRRSLVRSSAQSSLLGLSLAALAARALRRRGRSKSATRGFSRTHRGVDAGAVERRARE